MPEQLDPESVLREVAGLEGRIEELRQAAGLPDSDTRATLDAALVELELALAALRTVGGEQSGASGRTAAAEDERRVLKTVFTDAPVPMFLLDRDGGVRRVNRQAADLLGTSTGYVSGKQFTAFCDLATRAPLRSQLAAVVRTGRRCRVPVRFLGGERPVDAVVTLARVWIRGEPDPMVVAVAGPTTTPIRISATSVPAAERAEGDEADDDRAFGEPSVVGVETSGDEAVASLVHRMDVLAAVTEMLLDEPVFNETVAVRRCARLLAAELAEWVFIDLVPQRQSDGGGQVVAARNGDAAPRRHVVLGPEDEASEEAARRLAELDPASGTLPWTVFESGHSALRAHAEELDLLGADADGRPVLSMIGATSVLGVPVTDGDRTIGTITLAGSGEHGPFSLLDLSVCQRIGRYLGLVIRAARLYRRRAEVAATLQASLLPRTLPEIDGVELAARYTSATHGTDVGGDFYDAFPTKDGWGLVLGDVCGKGEDAAAVTATARHGVRLVSRWRTHPAEVLAAVNEALLSEDRFVTAVLAGIAPRGEGLRVTLGIAGHPPAIVVRADGVIRTASRGGVPLGLFDDFEAGLDTLDLAPGDTLVLHSDGLLEACAADRRQFGQARLLETLAAHAADPVNDMLGAVERTLLDFCDGDLRDDVSMLALRVLPPSLN
ncbi:SpoIIE family protein phosphatase [Actinomadura rupiterrae]|uniref:SpoIIE family protein phosphatase n=1 Tax=Actinomadura rupiterrae TaxID=559627 RepID=UPI0020A40FF5|nr:SpoIIE family protein phosphatase [Actinomadura rupiterrae]MCP2337034.1 GAF domain-containing protein/PAS domain-containing protein [Actinomadura rupiterrae]